MDFWIQGSHRYYCGGYDKTPSKETFGQQRYSDPYTFFNKIEFVGKKAVIWKKLI